MGARGWFLAARASQRVAGPKCGSVAQVVRRVEALARKRLPVVESFRALGVVAECVEASESAEVALVDPSHRHPSRGGETFMDFPLRFWGMAPGKTMPWKAAPGAWLQRAREVSEGLWWPFSWFTVQRARSGKRSSAYRAFSFEVFKEDKW